MYDKITQKMIDYYRQKDPGNMLLTEEAIIDKIKKELDSKIVNELLNFQDDTNVNFYKSDLKNVFGYGFAPSKDLELHFEKTLSYNEVKNISPIKTNLETTQNVKKEPANEVIEKIVQEEINSNDFNLKNFNPINGFINNYEIFVYDSHTSPSIVINSKNESTYIYRQDSKIIKTTEDSENYITKTYKYDLNGNLIYESNYDVKNNKLIYEKDYSSKEVASQLAKELENTDIWGNPIIKEILIDNTNTDINILNLMKEYYAITNTALPEIADAHNLNTFSEYIKEKLSKMNEIPDLNAFLEYSGIIDDFSLPDNQYETEYYQYRNKWEEKTGRKSFEYDFTNSNLKDEEKDKYLSMINYEANRTIEKFYKPNKIIEDNKYCVTFGNYLDNITIKNKINGKERIIDPAIFANMSTIDKAKFYVTIQSLPAEALEDMAIEFNNLSGTSGNEYNLKISNAAGKYNFLSEKTIINTSRASVIIHELGHAIDFNYNQNNNLNDSYSNNSEFNSVFIEEINNYIKDGNQIWSEENKIFKDKHGNICYCTSNVQEMFAECYTLLTLGYCNCMDTIKKYFPRCLESAKENLAQIRALPDDKRLKK